MAIVPGRFRSLMSDNLEAGIGEMFQAIAEMDLCPDHPIARAAIQCSDTEATAWAWAVGVTIGLPAEEIIQDDEYDGDGAFIRVCLGANAYLGINGLAHAGFCRVGRSGGLPRYPKLAFWTQAA